MDNYFLILSIIFPIILGSMAAFFLIISLRCILQRKAFLFSNRWLLLFVFIALVPTTLLPFYFKLADMDFMKMGLWDLLNPAMVTVLLVMMCFALKGYAAYGITDASFREALLDALEKLQLPHEESLSTIRLTSIDADLQVSIQSWLGTGLIKMKQREHRSLLSDIAREMNEHFNISTGPIKLTTSVFYLIMGVLMLIGGVGTLFLFRNIGS